jgi:hypothetical protein
MKTVSLSIALLFGAMSVPVYAQVKQDLKNAGQDTGDAAKTGAKKTGHGIKKGATTSTHAVKKGVHKTGNAMSDKTRDTSTHQ